MDTRKQVSRLLGLEIDEVSSVDRPANQHGLVTITKRDGDPMSKLFDAEGNEVDPTTLQVGDIVYDESDTELEYVDARTAEALAAEGEELFVPDEFLTNEALSDENEDELVGVGKASAMPDFFQAGKKIKSRALHALEEAGEGYSHGRTGQARTVTAGREVNVNARRAGAHVGRNVNAYTTGAAAGSTGAVYGRRKGRKSVHKSLGDTVLTELSKALTEGDRDQVISKAMEHVEEANERAMEAISKAERLEQQAELVEYVELAKSYELPVDETELGPILQVIAKSGLTNGQLELVDQIFHAASESTRYDELGSGGIAPSAVEEVVKSYAHEVVAKSDLSEAQATVALFEQNPEMYDAYLSEKA